MSLNTLQTAYANGDVIDASHINELTASLLGEMVGRNSSGVPTLGQSLGTAALPWGNLYASGIILGGSALDVSQITSAANRVVSGATRSQSSMPDFIRAAGTSASFTLQGATTNLVLSINNTATTVSTDIVTSSITLAPSSNNTATVNDTDMTNDFYAGEIDAEISEIEIDAVGSEISSRVGQVAAFRTGTNEIFQALIKDATTLTNVFRGYYFNSSGNPITRGNLSNNDTLTLMNIGWVFVEDNGTTVDVTYRTPSISFTAPNSPQTGDYWFDISNQVWKRYSGVSFEVIDRILVGQVVSDDTNTIASRSSDFSNRFREDNNVELDIFSTEIIRASAGSSRVNVYGTEIMVDISKLNWNITTDLETGLTESSDTFYYLYLSDKGEEIISDKRPYKRPDLKGHYHPYHSWRCVGLIYNDSSSDFATENNYFIFEKFNVNGVIPEVVTAKILNSGTASVEFQSYNFIESITRSALGFTPTDFQPGFFKRTPAVLAIVDDDSSYGNYSVELDQTTADNAYPRFFNSSGSTVDVNYTYLVAFQGYDYSRVR